MKILAAFIFTIFNANVLFAMEEISVNGVYTAGCFSCSSPASLTFSVDGQVANMTLESPDAECVMTFRTGTLIRSTHFMPIFGGGVEEVYEMPLLKSCNKRNIFGPSRGLILEKNSSGQLLKVKIGGFQKGRPIPRWIYFSAKISDY